MVKSHGRRPRAAERGATLFVVVLAITLLTGIGLFTVHSSAMLARAAGHAREAQQSDAYATAGTLAALSVVTSAPRLFTDKALAGSSDCIANLGVDTVRYGAQACFKFSNVTVSPVVPVALMAADSFGTALTSNSQPVLAGTFTSELTDVIDSQIAIAGYSAVPGTNNAVAQMRMAKLTTTAGVLPQVAVANCDPNLMQTAAQHMTRAHVMVGPVVQ